MLDLRSALEFVSEDSRAAEKFWLGALLSLAPILNLATLGYEVEVARRVAQGEPQALPEWNDLGRLWKQGARLGLAFFIYGLPSLLLVLSAIATLLAALVLSLQSESAQSGAGPTAPPYLLVILFVLFGLVVVYSWALGWLRPAIVGQYVERGAIQACFDFAAMGRFVRNNLGEYVRLWLAELVLGWIISLPLIFVVFALSLVPLAGPLIIAFVTAAATFFLELVSGHLVGQLLRARPNLSK